MTETRVRRTFAFLTAALLAGCSATRDAPGSAHARCDVESQLWRSVGTPPAPVLVAYEAGRDAVSGGETLWFASDAGAYMYCWPHDRRDSEGVACGAVRGTISRVGPAESWLLGNVVAAPCIEAPTDY